MAPHSSTLGGAWKAAGHGVTKSWAQLSDFTFSLHFHALEKAMATHSSIPAWRIPGTGEPAELPSLGSHRVGHDCSDGAATAAAQPALIQSAWNPYKKGECGHTRDTREAHSREETEATVRGQPSLSKTGASGETNHVNTLTLDLLAPEMEQINFRSLSHWVCSILLWQP